MLPSRTTPLRSSRRPQSLLFSAASFQLCSERTALRRFSGPRTSRSVAAMSASPPTSPPAPPMTRTRRRRKPSSSPPLRPSARKPPLLGPGPAQPASSRSRPAARARRRCRLLPRLCCPRSARTPLSLVLHPGSEAMLWFGRVLTGTGGNRGRFRGRRLPRNFDEGAGGGARDGALRQGSAPARRRCEVVDLDDRHRPPEAPASFRRRRAHPPRRLAVEDGESDARRAGADLPRRRRIARRYRRRPGQ